MRFLIGQQSDTLSLKSLARSRLKCWTGWKCKRRTGQGHLSIFPASCHGLILKHWALMRQVQSCEQFPNAKPPEMRGKGGAGDLPCRGARGCPLVFPSFPTRWGGYALSRKGDN